MVKAFITHKIGLLGLIVVLSFVLMAIFAPIIAPHDPIKQHIATARLEPPSSEYWLGTDELGRDIFSRLVYGARISISIGLLAEGIALFIGIVLGSIAGYAGGWLDSLLMRITDIFFTIPTLLFLIVMVAILEANLLTIALSMGLVNWPSEARLMRAEVLRLREQEFITAAHAIGVPPWRIIIRHLLPHTLAPMIVIGTLGIAGAILSEATLSFLGLGIQQPTPSWGTMVNQGQDYIFNAWWYSVFPGLTIMLIVLGFNFLGDMLRDMLAGKR